MLLIADFVTRVVIHTIPRIGQMAHKGSRVRSFTLRGFMFHEKINDNAPASGVKLSVASDSDYAIINECNVLFQRNGVKELSVIDVLAKRQ